MPVSPSAHRIEVDSLGVLTTTAAALRQARHIRIDQAQVRATAESMAAATFRPPVWDRQLHFGSHPPLQKANYVLVLDALNFCFWGEPRWHVRYHGRALDGYAALTAALKRALEDGAPILDPRYLDGLSSSDLAHVLRGEGEIPLLEQRVAHLREVGRVLLAKYDGSFERAVQAAGNSAVKLVGIIVDDFTSFNDVARYRGVEVRFYKRAQICVSDLHGAFGGASLGRFDDLDRLTAFADYKVPQMLRGLGIVVYSPELAELVDKGELIPAGSEQEIEIRAAAVWGVEYLRRELVNLGQAVNSFELDWYLWETSQTRTDLAPYHKTVTTFY